MSSDGARLFSRRGNLRARATIPEFQKQVSEADVLLAADVRNPQNTCVVFHHRRPWNDDWQNEKTAEVVTVLVDYETDDVEVLDELCKLLKGCCFLNK